MGRKEQDTIPPGECTCTVAIPFRTISIQIAPRLPSWDLHGQFPLPPPPLPRPPPLLPPPRPFQPCASPPTTRRRPQARRGQRATMTPTALKAARAGGAMGATREASPPPMTTDLWERLTDQPKCR